ncbi:hypothetical protein NPIL_695561 [Nephila pilipes]|uniref:Uncharacterized protein n=1 Tax=Nephila pilipes TaxID=299642 RepID=A0A8X6UCN8_NEPPI|nr:hypothetical protein NPIL_695561 [Nephila pilipes]
MRLRKIIFPSSNPVSFLSAASITDVLRTCAVQSLTLITRLPFEAELEPRSTQYLENVLFTVNKRKHSDANKRRDGKRMFSNEVTRRIVIFPPTHCHSSRLVSKPMTPLNIV